MKQVTMESVKQRIADLESAGKVVGGLSLSSEFELACLRELVAVTEQCDALVVENVALKKVISDVQGVYYKSDGVAGYHLNGQIATWDEVMPDLWEIETPATDAAIAALRAEAKAEAIPDGYVLVPQEMHLTAEAMEGICVHCGDGGHQFGEFTDGTLFVGEVDYGDGKKVYGLHIATAEYPEEGCATICEFARQLRESKGEVQS